MKPPVVIPPNQLKLKPPLHAQVEDELRRIIALPEHTQGKLLPDEITLANRFGVSRGTVRSALGRLTAQGLIERRSGVGTRVIHPASESGIGAWRSFSSEMARKGVRVENYNHDYSCKTCDKAAADALRLTREQALWRLDRVRGWDGMAVLHSRSWFHPRLGLKGTEDFSTKPLYDQLEASTGAVPETAHEEFVAVLASESLASQLDVAPGEPLLLRSHTVFDAGGRPIEFAQIHYVSSRFFLTLEIRHDQKKRGI